MTQQRKPSRREAIEELRREADELEKNNHSIKDYARNAYRARIRRELADKFEHELEQAENEKENANERE